MIDKKKFEACFYNLDSISKDDADELITFTRMFYAEVKNYLVKHFPTLL